VYERREVKPVESTPEQEHAPELQSRVDYAHRLKPSLSYGNAARMPQLQQELDSFDLVHLHYPFFGGAEPTLVRKAVSQNQGLVMTYHMDATGNGLRGTLFSAHRRVLLPWIVNRVDRILASSQNYIDGSAIAEIPNAMDRVEKSCLFCPSKLCTRKNSAI